jgi:hypothetical protein
MRQSAAVPIAEARGSSPDRHDSVSSFAVLKHRFEFLFQ